MALGAEVINFIGLNIIYDNRKIAAVGKVTVKKVQERFFVRVFIYMVNPASVK